MKKSVVCISVPKKTKDFLDDSHKGLGMTISEFVHICIWHYIKCQMDPETLAKIEQIRILRESLTILKQEEIE
jgi:hypothetical protein